ncbi:hypothetical protein [Thiomicrorhabdus sp. Milos-T2]|uniref:hypothetical protein n=1 Tax=Thiomicrorhabdus sp. Milos-T2 TaxID=90814 RepID=UPI0004940BCA|nr:hypothetical protein [Thiomicrorhabdus sp. Milos-T2]
MSLSKKEPIYFHTFFSNDFGQNKAEGQVIFYRDGRVTFNSMGIMILGVPIQNIKWNVEGADGVLRLKDVLAMSASIKSLNTDIRFNVSGRLKEFETLVEEELECAEATCSDERVEFIEGLIGVQKND